MNKQKFVPIISIILISSLAALFFVSTPSIDESELSQTFFIEGTFYDSKNYVEIRFIDKSQNSESVTLEILGLEDSYQRKYSQTNEIIEIVPFSNVPKYGWKIHPITLEIKHKDFGRVNLKTEIHSENESKPDVIISGS